MNILLLRDILLSKNNLFKQITIYLYFLFLSEKLFFIHFTAYIKNIFKSDDLHKSLTKVPNLSAVAILWLYVTVIIERKYTLNISVEG